MLTTKADIRSAFPNAIEKVEFGSGHNPEPGYVHVDIGHNLPDLDICSDVRHTPIPDNYVVSEVRAVHILEHFCHPEYSKPAMQRSIGTTTDVLKEAYRILRPGGKLRIVTPDFEKICSSSHLKRVDPYWLQRWMMGGHEDQYDVHHWVWSMADARKWFRDVGFVKCQDWNPISSDEEQKLQWKTPAKSGNAAWHAIEWYHWLFYEGTKP